MNLVVPTGLVWADDVPVVVFGEVAIGRLALPFWSQTIDGARIVEMAPLDTVDPPSGDLGLAGVIFHMSRCGSTLVSRQCSAVDDVLGLSEPPVFEHLVDRPTRDVDLRALRLGKLVALHRDALRPWAGRLVIKWSALTGLYAAEIEQALPGVPAVFLHRSPLEVMLSIETEPPGALERVTPRHLGAAGSSDAVRRLDPLGLSARLLARVCRSVAATRRTRAVGYDRLPDATANQIAPFFGLQLSAVDRAAMATVAAAHSKDPDGCRPFRRPRRRDVRADDPVRLVTERVLTPALAEATERLQPL